MASSSSRDFTLEPLPNSTSRQPGPARRAISGAQSVRIAFAAFGQQDDLPGDHLDNWVGAAFQIERAESFVERASHGLQMFGLKLFPVDQTM